MILNFIRIIQDTILTVLKLFIVYNLILKHNFLFGICCYLIGCACYRIFIYKIFNVIPLSYKEIPFLAFQTQSILVASIDSVQEEITPTSIKDLLINEINRNIKRMRLQLTYNYFLFNYYWKEVEFEDIKQNIIIVDETISKNELNKYILSELNNRNEFCSNNIPYVIKITKYKDEMGIMIMIKYNRILCDESLIMKVLCNICGDNLSMKRKSKYGRVVNYMKYLPLVLLYKFPLSLYKMLVRIFKFKFNINSDNNIIKLNGYIGKAYSFKIFNNKCLKQKTTFNNKIFEIIKQIEYFKKSNNELILNIYDKDFSSSQFIFTSVSQLTNKNHELNTITYSTLLYIFTQFLSYRVLYYIIKILLFTQTTTFINIISPVPFNNKKISSIVAISSINNQNIPFISTISFNNTFNFTISSFNNDNSNINIINDIDNNIDIYINS